MPKCIILLINDIFYFNPRAVDSYLPFRNARSLISTFSACELVVHILCVYGEKTWKTSDKNSAAYFSFTRCSGSGRPPTGTRIL